jgi:hypothetical protein
MPGVPHLPDVHLPIMRRQRTHRRYKSGAKSDPKCGTWVSAQSIGGDDPFVSKIAMSCAPASSNDGRIVYVATGTFDFGFGYLVALDYAEVFGNGHNRIAILDPNAIESDPVILRQTSCGRSLREETFLLF